MPLPVGAVIMSARAIVWVLRDEARGICLVTGKGHDELVREIAPLARWSRSGRGWVISLSEAADLACVADISHAICRERQRESS
jgi:hypothetical protein